MRVVSNKCLNYLWWILKLTTTAKKPTHTDRYSRYSLYTRPQSCAGMTFISLVGEAFKPISPIKPAIKADSSCQDHCTGHFEEPSQKHGQGKAGFQRSKQAKTSLRSACSLYPHECLLSFLDFPMVWGCLVSNKLPMRLHFDVQSSLSLSIPPLTEAVACGCSW